MEEGCKMVFSLVLAGGTGSRMGSGMPKQYLMAAGKPVIIHTLDKFCNYGGFEKIIVLCPGEWTGYTDRIIQEYMGSHAGSIAVTEGGPSRNETIMEGIRYIRDNFRMDDNTIIVTHDAARPFINNRIISENIETALQYGAATTAVPATDTILCSSKESIVESITDRSVLYMCQTPQTFFAKRLYGLYEALDDMEKEKFTDASGIYIKNGLTVKIVQGEMYNIKITYPNDLVIAEAYIKNNVV